MTHSPSVLVCGYYGFGNSGDEAILSVLLRDLNRVFDSPSITVIGGSTEEIAADHQVDAIHWTDLAELRQRAADSDLMVLGGGGLFQDQQEFDATTMLTSAHGGISYWAGFALLSHLVGKPLAVYGVGVGPISTDDGKRLTSISFRAAAAASVRDDESARILNELWIPGVPITADPVFTMTADPKVGLEILANESIPQDRSLIAVAVRSWTDDGFIPALAEQLDRLTEAHDARIVFVPFQTAPHRAENDPAAALRVLNAMQRPDLASILRGTYTPEDKMAVQSTASLVIGMRLHSVIMAAVSGVPVVALAYDPKVASVMNALGIGEMTLGLDDVKSLAEKADQSLADSNYRTTMNSRVPELRARAELNAKVLTDALTGHQPIEDPVVREAAALAIRHIEIGAALQDQEALTSQISKLEADRQRLQTQWDHLVGSRSMKLVNSWWTVRNRFKRRDEDDSTAASDYRKQLVDDLNRILATHKDAAGIVVYPPTIGWTAQLFQRPQQMALAFARMGYLTFFGVQWGGAEEVRGFRYEEDRLCLTGLPIEHLSILHRIPNPLMVSYVYNFEFRRNLTNPTTVFEHIDHLNVFASSFEMDRLNSWYDGAIADADVVTASARDLQVEVLPRRADAILCPNGVTFEHFAGYRPGPIPQDLAEVLDRGRPIVGYYGALAEWVDYELLDHAAQNLPDYSFVFIGPNYDRTMDDAPAFRRPNVSWLGPKSYGELPGYLHHFSVATIPFKVNEVTHRVSPLKLFEYMAGGKPVVTTAMRETQYYENVLIAHDRDEWVKLLVEGCELDRAPSFVSSLRRTARANTWDQRVGTLIDAAARKKARA